MLCRPVRAPCQDQLLGIRATADLELWSFNVGQPFETDRGAALLVCGRHRLVFSQPTVEAYREGSGCIAAQGATHADDATNVRQYRLGLHVTVTGIEDD